MMATTTIKSVLLSDEPVAVFGIPGGVEFSELGPDRVLEVALIFVPSAS